MVVAEESLFGLPSISTDVGGIATAIKDDRNGKIFSLNANIEEYIWYIRDIMSSNEKYRDLALSSFREYEERLNRSSAGNSVRQLIRQYCG